MNLAGAPFIIADHNHEVDLAIATIVPLIFLTALLPEAPDKEKDKQWQYAAQALTIVFGVPALAVAFLQLAGKQTNRGTELGLILLGATALFAICAMAWRTVTQLSLITWDIFLAAIVAFLLLLLLRLVHPPIPKSIYLILLPILTLVIIPARIADRIAEARQKETQPLQENVFLRPILTLFNVYLKYAFGERTHQQQETGKQNNTPEEQSSAVADQSNTVTEDDAATKNSRQTGQPGAPPT